MTEKSNMKFKKVRLDSLHEDSRNARRHDKANLKAIEMSLLTWGQVEPLVVNLRSGFIIGGNGRVEAMRSLGWDTCIVNEVDLNETQAKALGLALNRTAELAEWNPERLNELLRELNDASFDIDLLGFDVDKVDFLTSAENETLDNIVKYELIVETHTEMEQQKLFEELVKRGLKCTIL